MVCETVRKAIGGQKSNYEHEPAMLHEVFEAVKPIYVDLSRAELPTRCLGGFSQNSNESFNAIVWSVAA